MTARRTLAAARLWDGSGILARRIRDRLARWVAAGRRDDLKGWTAILGCILRAGLLLAVAYGIARLIRAFPAVLWVVAPAWVIAAYRVGKPTPAAADPAPVEEMADAAARDPAETVRALLLDVLGDRPAVHLSEVLKHLQERGQWQGKKVADLRARLEGLGIPVDPKVKVRGVPTRGVRRADLLTAPRSATEEPSPEVSTAV